MARVTKSAKAAAVEPRGPPRVKELSFSFRAECMTDVVRALANILSKHAVMRSLTHYSAKTPGMVPDVDVVLVFRLYEGHMDRFIDSIATALTALSNIESNLDCHVINESINFTDEYDESRTHTGKQRDTILARVPEKLANMPFIELPLIG
jgi:hypothetical protein